MNHRSGAGLLICGLLLAACETAPSAPQTTSDSPVSAASSATSSVASSALSPSAKPTSSAPSADEAAVKQVFLDYRNAIGTKNGKAAADASATRTLDYYERVRKSALTMPEKELRAAPISDRFMILLIRGSVEAAALRKMDGRALFEHSVNEGMVGKDTQSLEPDAVEIDGDTASLGMRARGSSVPPQKGFRLYREKGAWKLDVLSIMSAMGPSLQQTLSKIDPDVDAAMVMVVEQLRNKPLAKTIWIAPDAAKPGR